MKVPAPAMLFKVKKNFPLSVILALCLAGVSLALKHALGLEWRLSGTGGFGAGFITGLAGILASDLLLVIIFAAVFRGAFIGVYMEMADYFRGQGAPGIAAGGLLAAGEEMIFRGIILQGMIQALGSGPVYAVLVSSVLFGLFHVIARRRLALFSVWAVWEGAVLGVLYLYTGSILVTAAVHAAHDILGFTVFAVQRKRGFFLAGRRAGF